MPAPSRPSAGKRLPPAALGGQSARTFAKTPRTSNRAEASGCRSVQPPRASRRDRGRPGAVSLRERRSRSGGPREPGIKEARTNSDTNRGCHTPAAETTALIAAARALSVPEPVRTCTCHIQIEGERAFVLIDTGSMVTIVSPAVLDLNTVAPRKRPVGIILKSASGHEIPITHQVTLEFTLGKEKRKHDALVCPEIRQDAIIGFDFIQRHDVRINAADQSIQVADSGRIPLRGVTGGDLAGICVTRVQPPEGRARPDRGPSGEDRRPAAGKATEIISKIGTPKGGALNVSPQTALGGDGHEGSSDHEGLFRSLQAKEGGDDEDADAEQASVRGDVAGGDGGAEPRDEPNKHGRQHTGIQDGESEGTAGYQLPLLTEASEGDNSPGLTGSPIDCWSGVVEEDSCEEAGNGPGDGRHHVARPQEPGSIRTEEGRPDRSPQGTERVINVGRASPEERSRLLQLVDEYPECFAWNGELGRCDLIQHRIHLTSDVPVHRPAYKVAHADRQVIEKEVREMLDKGVIEPSISPYAAGVVLVPKKSGETRFCVDYRGLNKITRTDHYPLPLARTEIFDTLGEAKVFSCLDCQQGYWQVGIAEEDRHKTAFRCFLGQFHFNRLAFGLKTAGSTYQRLMSHILSGYTGKFCHCFIDDIICYSNTFEEHLIHLRLLFIRLKEAGIKLKPSKCVLAKEKVHYLGHVISPGEIRPDPDNVCKIRDLAQPTTAKQVRAFLGMASYYRTFVKDFSRRAKPLTELTKKHVTFRWGPDEEEAFDDLKKALTEEPVLALPDFTKPFVLMTDGSSTGLGAVLGQRHEGDAKERVIGYASRRTNRQEQNYSACELECLALVWASKHFREYIIGRLTEVRTDHWALKWLQDLKSANPRLQRWRLSLQEYDLDIRHKPGSQHRNADFLSRMYEDEKVGSEPREGTPEKEEREPSRTPGRRPTVAAITRSLDRVPPGDLHGFESPTLGSGAARRGGKEEEDASTARAGPTYPPDGGQPRTIGIGRQALARLQREDNDCQEIRQAIEAGEALPSWAQKHVFRIRDDDVLERVNEQSHRGEEETQIVLPRELVRVAVQDAHAGHLKTGKTLGNLRRSYFFRNMYVTCTKYIEGCQICQRKDRGRKILAPLGDMPQPMGAWHTVAVDVLGPLPQTRKGNKYVIVITDYLTRFVLAVATRDQTAETTADTLMRKFLEYGLPERLITDNGPNFRSRVLAQMCKILRTAHTFTTPYHPQFDGLCERFNRTVASMLRGFVADHQRDWDLHLPYLLHAYRAAPQESTKESPFFLMFGRPSRAPLDLYLRPANPGYPEAPSEVIRAKPEAVVRMHAAFQAVQGQLRDARDNQKRNHDRISKERHFEVGDEVLLLDERVGEGRTKKLHVPWKPGYRVVEVIGPWNYRIEHPSRRGNVLRVHINRLKAHKPEYVWPKEACPELISPGPQLAEPRSQHLERWLREERNKHRPFEHDQDPYIEDSSEVEAEGNPGPAEPNQDDLRESSLPMAAEALPKPVEPRPEGRNDPCEPLFPRAAEALPEPVEPRPEGTQKPARTRSTPARRQAFETSILRRSDRTHKKRQLYQY